MNAPDSTPRRVCFVTGTRAEFGLMASTLAAIRGHPALNLQIVATGMHLDPSRGQSLNAIAAAGFIADRVVEWPADGRVAANTGGAMAGIAEAVAELQSDIILVVGDRAEAFAAAAAGHLAGRIVAHVHGGDRALGQVDDALRHAITKLSHLHFVATPGSANRVYRLGERKRRIYLFGAPGIDGIVEAAAPSKEIAAAGIDVAAGRFALLAYHPTADDDELERQRAVALLHAFSPAAAVCPPGVSLERLVVIYPNNDSGSAGIVRQYDEWAESLTHVTFLRDVPRPIFLGLMRDAAVMAGNSSAGVIEAASFGTPVVDVGPRQKGRERSANVVHCGHRRAAIRRAVRAALTAGRFTGPNVYGGGGAGVKIANALADVQIDERLRRKLIRY